MIFVAFWWICSYFLILVLLNLDANHHFLFKKNPPQRYTPPHLRSNNRPSMAASHKASGCHFSWLPCLGFTKTSPSRASKIQPRSFFLPNFAGQLSNGKWWRFQRVFFLKKWKGEAQFCTGSWNWKFRPTPNQKKTWLWVPAVNFPGSSTSNMVNLKHYHKCGISPGDPLVRTPSHKLPIMAVAWEGISPKRHPPWNQQLVPESTPRKRSRPLPLFSFRES